MQPCGFRQNSGSFFFHAGFERVVIFVRKLASAVFEVQVAHVFVDHFFTFLQVVEASFLRTRAGAQRYIENVEKRRKRNDS